MGSGTTTNQPTPRKVIAVIGKWWYYSFTGQGIFSQAKGT